MKIQRLSDVTPGSVPVYRCNRCCKVILRPVDLHGVYVWDGKNPTLVCPSCVIGSDLYIWGNIEVL